jgi:hypothetical protein
MVEYIRKLLDYCGQQSFIDMASGEVRLEIVRFLVRIVKVKLE